MQNRQAVNYLRVSVFECSTDLSTTALPVTGRMGTSTARAHVRALEASQACTAQLPRGHVLGCVVHNIPAFTGQQIMHGVLCFLSCMMPFTSALCTHRLWKTMSRRPHKMNTQTVEKRGQKEREQKHARTWMQAQNFRRLMAVLNLHMTSR